MPNSIMFIVLLFIQNSSKSLTSLPPLRLSAKLGLFLGTVSGYKQMLYLQILLKK